MYRKLLNTSCVSWPSQGQTKREPREMGKENVPVLILVLVVDAAHESGRGRQDLVDEDEDSLLRGELDALADYINELTNGQIGRDKIFLLVDGSDIALLDFFADDLFLVMWLAFASVCCLGSVGDEGCLRQWRGRGAEGWRERQSKLAAEDGGSSSSISRRMRRKAERTATTTATRPVVTGDGKEGDMIRQIARRLGVVG